MRIVQSGHSHNYSCYSSMLHNFELVFPTFFVECETAFASFFPPVLRSEISLFWNRTTLDNFVRSIMSDLRSDVLLRRLISDLMSFFWDFRCEIGRLRRPISKKGVEKGQQVVSEASYTIFAKEPKNVCLFCGKIPATWGILYIFVTPYPMSSTANVSFTQWVLRFSLSCACARALPISLPLSLFHRLLLSLSRSPPPTQPPTPPLAIATQQPYSAATSQHGHTLHGRHGLVPDAGLELTERVTAHGHGSSQVTSPHGQIKEKNGNKKK